MRSTTRIAMGLALAVGLLVSCSTAPSTQESRNELLEKATATMREMNRENPEVEAFAGKGTGYAVFPEVIKAAWSSAAPMVVVSCTRAVSTSATPT